MDLSYRADRVLLQGCWLEASRADVVSMHLQALLKCVTGVDYPSLVATIEEMRRASGILRELADLSQIHQDRVPVVLNYLNTVLPCLSRTLRDIQGHYDDKSASRHKRWQRMSHQMAEEVGGLVLAERFHIYKSHLACLRNLLTRSPEFDLNSLETFDEKIMKMRETRGIPPPPSRIGPVFGIETLMAPMIDPNLHWAENIFSLPLPSRTKQRNQHPSLSFGPHETWGHLTVPQHSKILFRRSFNDDFLSLTALNSAEDGCPYFVIRTFHEASPWFSIKGAHELCIDRDGSSLQLKRWSYSENCSKLWAILFFPTWEEMVLFHCTFLSLKARNERTLQFNPEEYNLNGEHKLFQARIVDDGFKHSLIVFKDRSTGGLRLHAAVWDGELRQCPVWTAFVTHQSTSPTWLKRTSRNKVRLADVQLYVFCCEYRQQSQRRGGLGPFEIDFFSDEAARRFKELFQPRVPEIAAAPRGG